MTRHQVPLFNDRLRDVAISYIRKAVPGTRVEFKGPKRSNDKNAAMWAMLADISSQLIWHTKQLDSEAWKLVFIDALRREHKDELQLVPNTDMTGFVNVSPTSSSDLSEDEMSELLTIISAFGDQHGVVWSEPKKPMRNRPVPPIDVYEADIADRSSTQRDNANSGPDVPETENNAPEASKSPDTELIRHGASAARDGEERIPPDGLTEFQQKTWLDAYDNEIDRMENEAGVSA